MYPKGMPNMYYARPISVDNTPQAERDIALIQSLGFSPYPVGDEKKEVLVRYREIGMEAFRPYVENSAALIFRAFPDGSIGVGVAKEIAWAKALGIPVIEFPRQVERRSLTAEQTQAMLAELGQR
jgi:hypothetical protein